MEEKLLEQQYIDSSDFDIEMRFLLEGLMALTMVSGGLPFDFKWLH